MRLALGPRWESTLVISDPPVAGSLRLPRRFRRPQPCPAPGL